MNLDECADIAAAVKAAKIKFQIGFMRRFDRGFIARQGSNSRR